MKAYLEATLESKMDTQNTAYIEVNPQQLSAHREAMKHEPLGSGVVCHECDALKGVHKKGCPAAPPVEEVSKVPAESTPEFDLTQCLRYAEQLAQAAHKHYPEVPQWKPLSGDMFGLLMQIDNMLTGLTRASSPEPKPAMPTQAEALLRGAEEIILHVSEDARNHNWLKVACKEWLTRCYAVLAASMPTQKAQPVETNGAFGQWFDATFGKPTNTQQEMVMSCCLHAWRASRDSIMPTQKAADGVALIAAERKRQMEVEGWTPEHDDEHKKYEMTRAGIAYAQYAERHGRYAGSRIDPPFMCTDWPKEWDIAWFKASDDSIRNLVKAGALIAAEIDRLQRAAPPESKEPVPTQKAADPEEVKRNFWFNEARPIINAIGEISVQEAMDAIEREVLR